VLKNGRIELMQQRRLYQDDWRGMGEPLNEVDQNGNPIAVPAQYFLQIFNYEKEVSAQRHLQLRQDDPLQYFFQFHSQVETGLKSSKVSNNKLVTLMSGSYGDSNDAIKINMFPVQKNTILLRLENIGDLFDSGSQ